MCAWVNMTPLVSTVLKTDLKDVMTRIEQALHKYHECVAAEQAHQTPYA